MAKHTLGINLHCLCWRSLEFSKSLIYRFFISKVICRFYFITQSCSLFNNSLPWYYISSFIWIKILSCSECSKSVPLGVLEFRSPPSSDYFLSTSIELIWSLWQYNFHVTIKMGLKVITDTRNRRKLVLCTSSHTLGHVLRPCVQATCCMHPSRVGCRTWGTHEIRPHRGLIYLKVVDNPSATNAKIFS